jgi:hypothetical protein
MKLEDIISHWEQDSHIDRLDLGEEILKIPQLHAKYYKIYLQEIMQLRKLETEFKVLKLDKFEFFTQGHTKESKDRGWELPSKGVLLKTDANNYIDADKDIIDIALKIGLQQEKVSMLESIIKSFINRGYNIKAAIEYERFRSGG